MGLLRWALSSAGAEPGFGSIPWALTHCIHLLGKTAVVAEVWQVIKNLGTVEWLGAWSLG